MNRWFPLIYVQNAVAAWKAILACFVVTLALAFAINLTLPDTYTARMVLGPKTSSMLNGSGSGFGRIGGALGTLAALQGQSGDSNYDRYRALLTSQDLANGLLRDRSLVAHVFRLEWDSGAQIWRRPGGLWFDVKQSIKTMLCMRLWRAPGTGEMTRFLRQNVQASLDRSNNFTTLSYEDEDPEFARTFLLKLHGIADGMMRQTLLQTSQSRMDYLNAQLSVTNLTDARKTLMELLLAETNNIMIGRADVGFAVEVIDQPSVPEAPSGPPRLVIVALLPLLVLFLSAFFFAIRADKMLREIIFITFRGCP